MTKHKLIERCELTLRQNDLGNWTRPAPGLYPHQWLWDSCFIAIGLRHKNVKRAQIEIDSLFRGQWKNGMIPNIIHGKGDYYADKLWSKRSPDMPTGILTSGVTQPPLIAEAMVRIGEKLSKTERISWYKHHFNRLLAYHEWLYRERDPDGTGLVTLIHPWESGIDNSPSWMHTVHQAHKPLWIQLCQLFGFTGFLEKMRKDTRLVPARERIDTVDALLLFHHAKKIVAHNYNNKKLARSSHIGTVDVLFNSILVRANTLLQDIADEIEADLPAWLEDRMHRAERSLDSLWDAPTHHYFDQTHLRRRPIKIASIGRYLPLYSGAISQKRADLLAKQLREELKETIYPIASVPFKSPYFNHHRYWQGPTWINTNWLIIDGLERYGHTELAHDIRERSLKLVSLHGPYEYFSPLDGTPVGAHQFSWSAALAVDLAKYSP